MSLYDRLLAAMTKMLGRKDLESQILLRVMSDLSITGDVLERAIELAEAS